MPECRSSNYRVLTIFVCSFKLFTKVAKIKKSPKQMNRQWHKEEDDGWHKSFGNMTDAYIPPQKNKAGNNYAFIRFVQVKDPKRLLDNFNTIKIDGSKIAANVAKYDKNKRRVLHDRPGKQLPKSTRPPAHSFNHGVGAKSYKDALRNQMKHSHSATHLKTVHISDPCAEHYKLWKDCALVGEVGSMAKMGNLQVGLNAEGVQDISIKFLSGLMAMIIFKTSALANNFLVNGKATWSNWFSDLQMWSGQHVEYQRVAWIKIEGLPLHMWDRNCFDSIGGLFGRVLSPAVLPHNSSDLSSGCMSILVKSIGRIEEKVEVLWKDQRFSVFVCEDIWPWVPGFVDSEYVQPSEEDKEGNYDGISEDLNAHENMEAPEEGEFRPDDADSNGDADPLSDGFLESPLPPPVRTTRFPIFEEESSVVWESQVVGDESIEVDAPASKLHDAALHV
ncbi:hypothetical protein LXL04_010354 [Taraxacum kok-saghyz]